MTNFDEKIEEIREMTENMFNKTRGFCGKDNLDLLHQLEQKLLQEKAYVRNKFTEFNPYFIESMKKYIEFHEKLAEINDSLHKLGNLLANTENEE